MAYLTITRISGDPQKLMEMYRQTSARMSEVGRDHGMILHATTPTEEGLLMLNFWPSRENADAATGDPRRNQVIADHGLSPDQFSREHHEVEEYEVFQAPAG